MTEAKFTKGSTMRHVLVMSASGSIGLFAMFLADFMNIYFVSLLGEVETAAVGYAVTITFFNTSVSIGLSIAVGAVVSHAIGSRRRKRARKYVLNTLIYSLLVSVFVVAIQWPFLGDLLSLLGAEGRTHDVAMNFLKIAIPSMPFLVGAMAMSGVLRAVGDAKRGMLNTLSIALVNAALDPILIFALSMGVEGAATAMVVARASAFAIGAYSVFITHGLTTGFNWTRFKLHSVPITRVALPAILTNAATPIGTGFVVAAISSFGDDAVKGFAIVSRLAPLAFGPVFALSGSVGPILGQNLGAKLYDRIARAFSDSVLIVFIYCISVASLLFLLQDQIANIFDATGDAANLIHFYCTWIGFIFFFQGTLFVANATFNNLGRPTFSTMFNMGRATIGTIPFVWLGAPYGPEGIIAATTLGASLFGVAAFFVAKSHIHKLASGEASPRHRPGGRRRGFPFPMWPFSRLK